MLEVWTDGSSGQDGSGGWAAIVVRDNVELIRLNGHASNTTNNRMELTGAIQGIKMGLKYIQPGEQLIVRSDSAYVVNCFVAKWYDKWRKCCWISSTGQPVKNKDLWQELLDEALPNQQLIMWTHVKGHAGTEWNEQADRMAHEARMKIVSIMNEAGGSVCQA